ncbi:hypothetical protein [Planomicrobium sp. CPCC 101110]|uniref:hypothetical protein n=1 Tax=Planomicrobium sp. CPCC 101110 TaxID=2599619 RepID=UPI0011B5615A|nr:hypothetical protein [Planomicrobium sp. CPCC 101110]TWT28364.1 hypothetical protein FQV30_07635 [Planomicrobium sp. CPCC 101110]
MEPRKKRKNRNHMPEKSHSGLSYGVLNVQHHQIERKPNKFFDFLTQTFLFLLGGVILCGMLYALVSYT